MNKTGDNISAENANWKFSGEAAQHFDDHVQKSLPLYDMGHELIVKLSDFFINEGSVCYDLGCSTGKLIQALAERNVNKKGVTFIGVDQEKDMLIEAKKRTASIPSIKRIESNALDLEFQKSDLIICYYTMQFIPPKNRQLLFDRIYEALNWGGAFILFEKVRAPDARFQDIATSLYTDFKLDQGYEPNEIIAKSRSLKGILEPFSTQGNLDLMKRAGFVDTLSIMKYVFVEGFLAIK